MGNGCQILLTENRNQSARRPPRRGGGKGSGLALQRLAFEAYAGQAGAHQGADVAVVAAFRGGQHGTVVLAEGQQGLLQAEAFQ
ncbi:hypothetical protein D3C85_1481880 [compost metagenome]